MASSNLNDVFQFLNTINPIVSDISKAGETGLKKALIQTICREYTMPQKAKEKK